LIDMQKHFNNDTKNKTTLAVSLWSDWF
jgi:hypothetical protein